MLAALYIDPDGIYSGIAGLDLWDRARDARRYAGPWPVIAHPPCERWGRFWHGSPRKPHRYQLGDDGGCFASALAAVRRWGGVLEHPADSRAWQAHGLNSPPHDGGWLQADRLGGWTCRIEQGQYGHAARKRTWLYAVGTDLPWLRWGSGPQVLDPGVVSRHGYAYARRQGLISLIGGTRKQELRNATPAEFRDLLIAIAATARRDPRERWMHEFLRARICQVCQVRSPETMRDKKKERHAPIRVVSVNAFDDQGYLIQWAPPPTNVSRHRPSSPRVLAP